MEAIINTDQNPGSAPASGTAPDLSDVLSNVRWVKSIEEFERRDAQSPPPQNSIVFAGSSSIRGWKTLEYDFPQYSVINRGFGGSHMCDVLYFADRIVLPYKPRAVVVYEGDNDIQSGKKPELIFEEYKSFCRIVHESYPQCPILFISVKASTARWDKKERILALNHLVRDWSNEDVRLGYADCFYPMLGSDGLPVESLLVKDGLHMTRAGYLVWVEQVTRELKKLLSS